MFVFRGGQLIDSFPMENEAQFGLTPASLCSVNRYVDHHKDLTTWEGPWRRGDWLVLATDALAA